MEIPRHALALAFGLTAAAGLATGIGSALAFFARRASYRFLSAALGFSAGVMLYVSFVEILPKAQTTLSGALGAAAGGWAAVGSFFAGVVVIGLIDLLVPRAENPHEMRTRDAVAALGRGPGALGDTAGPGQDRLLRMGLFSALAIAIHNFPEGVATFLATLEHPRLGAAIALAVALHNIPEGVSVAVPIYYATGSRRRAFGLSFLSGLSEPAGAVLVWLVLRPVLSPTLMGAVFGAVAGIMVYIALDELLPTAREYGHEHEVLLSLFSGMAVIATSLVLMR